MTCENGKIRSANNSGGENLSRMEEKLENICLLIAI